MSTAAPELERAEKINRRLSTMLNVLGLALVVTLAIGGIVMLLGPIFGG